MSTFLKSSTEDGSLPAKGQPLLPDPKKIKALALDLDGTVLAPETLVTGRTRRAIDACKKKGLKIIIVTGRSIEGSEQFRKALELEGPMVYFNGAAVADMPGNNILLAEYLDKKVIEFCVDLSREMDVYYQVFFSRMGDAGRISLMAERDSPELQMYQKHTGIRAEVNDIKKAIGASEFQGCLKSMFIAAPEILSALRPKVEKKFGKGIYITHTLLTFLELMNSKASKGNGLGFVMERLSLKAEEIIAFGDEENDLPMFEAAGFSIAPSNAKDTVKARADCVIGSNAEDGVAAFLEGYFSL